jgi:hypothetical protein
MKKQNAKLLRQKKMRLKEFEQKYERLKKSCCHDDFLLLYAKRDIDDLKEEIKKLDPEAA